MLTCFFVGDVMPGSKSIHEKPHMEILREFGKADFVFGNLESPLVRHPPSKLNLNKIPLWSRAEHIEILKRFCFTHFCLNNNHSFDLFEKGLDETIELLNKAKIKAFGFQYDGIDQFEIFEKNGIRFGIFAVNWVQTEFNQHLSNDLKNISIGKAKENVDFLICFLHWGDDHNVFINEDQQKTARNLVEQGVDLIVGHHPHVLQGYEIYNEKYIFYSLGNFIFTPKESYDYLPYTIRYHDQRENVLFQRTECKIGQYVSIVFNKNSYQVAEISPVYREHTLPDLLPEQFLPFYNELTYRMNDQVVRSRYELNEAEKKRILFSYTLPLILKRPIFWPILFKKLILKLRGF